MPSAAQARSSPSSIRSNTRSRNECLDRLRDPFIPGENDSDEELEALTQLVTRQLKADVPFHFTAFHPDYRIWKAPAPPPTLQKARAIAIETGFTTSMSATSTIRRAGDALSDLWPRAIGATAIRSKVMRLTPRAGVQLRDRMAGVFAEEARRVGLAAPVGRHRTLRGVRRTRF